MFKLIVFVNNRTVLVDQFVQQFGNIEQVDNHVKL